ncbi:family 78 glycoside hydrolase catalytic domain [Amycolatopsis rhabdoformis]|uniref:alpha-L-rhamnosidase n=1 Tax=Amycolatopsis rhabdoformis TaxID=1448059 RepID=A0ABZ1IHX4_9PSEU|nr:family 78 glycoside hydrolase catalytic domain [Amycolatopsis rhabdoformis]WSE34049.1 family 78 glycoside hydrolase catalytic domain [Amycolatopsis rhabdoformis]
MTGAVTVNAPRIGLSAEPFVATATPRLSWKTVAGTDDWTQAGAEIELTVGTAGTTATIDGDQSVFVAWPFAPLRPRETVRVRVRVRGADGVVSPWSEPTEATAGFLGTGEWGARFVGSGSDDPQLLRAAFEVRGLVRRAFLYATAFGAYDVRLNGATVDDAVLKPGWTSYQWRLLYDVTDVTAHLRSGTNTFGIELAGGWYTEAYGFRDRARRFYEGSPAAAAQLVIEYEDGTTATVVTDESWRCSPGPVVAASIYQGETYDARLLDPGWASSTVADGDWSPVVPVEVPAVRPRPRTSQPVRVIERREVVDVITTPSGATVVDFGQNLVGWVRITVSGPRGHTITLRHAEVLERGELGTRPLRNAAATDRYTLAGDGEETWEPKWTFHGFRYVEIHDWPGEFSPASISAAVVHTDLPRTGGFSTSHALLNRLHENVVWGMRGNFLSIPTDCPQRDERLGWTGDIQVFAPTASFLYDCNAFLRSWLEDVRLEQTAAGGVVPMVVPAVIPQVPGQLEPVAAWGDAVTVVPAVLGERFGDQGALGDSLAAMKSWVDTITARTGGSPLWESGVQFGDWLDPDAPPDQPGRAKTDPGLVATAYYFRSADLTARAAQACGNAEDARHYRELAGRIGDAFRATYTTAAGRMMSDAPTAYAVAIAFGLVEGERKAAMGERLRHLVRAYGYHIATGFVGTPIICDALTATGHVDTAARLLAQTESPSWLYPVTMGATTIWERWDSMLEDGSINPGQMTSFNHYALGAVADWLHRVVAGLAPLEPGYRRIRIAPTLLDFLDDASAWHETPYGRASSAWRRDGEVVRFDVEVPANTRARVRLPSGVEHEVGSGSYTWTERHPRPRRSRAELGLDSDLATIVDDREAYRAVLGAISAIDPDRAAAFRRTTRWTPGRSLRDPLSHTPLDVVDAIEKALAALPAGELS